MLHQEEPLTGASHPEFEAPSVMPAGEPMHTEVPSKPSFLSRFFDWMTHCSIVALAALMPLWFLPVTVDVLELNKQTLALVLTLIATMGWVGRSLIDKKISFTRSWLHAVVLFFLAGYLVTSFFSIDRYISFVGNVGQMQWAFSTIAIFVLMYFVVTNTFTIKKCIYTSLFAFVAGSALAGLYGICQMLGLPLLGSAGPMAVRTFNTIGTSNALATFLAIPMLISLSMFVLGGVKPGSLAGYDKKWKEMLATVFVYASFIIGLIVAIIVDFWAAWILLLVGTLLLVGLRFAHERHVCAKPAMITSIVLALVSVLFLFIQTPVTLPIPAEVSPSLSHTWMISQQALRDHPLFGTGPGTWIYDYAQYRSVGVNVSQFWTIRFERGLTAFFTLIAMIGLVGIAFWLILIISALVKAVSHLFKTEDREHWQLSLIVFVGWFSTVLLAFLYNYNVAHHFVFWFLLAILGALVGRMNHKVETRATWISSVLSVVMVLLGVISLSAIWLSCQRFMGEYRYSQAVSSFQQGGNVDDSIMRLQSAIALNRMNDVYYRNLSQAYLVKVSQITQQEATEDKIQEVNNLIASAVESAKRATEVGPMNVDNYSNLATVYQSIASFTKGADEFAIQAYQTALSLEPNNPVFMNEVGKLFVLRSDAYRTLLGSAEEGVAKEAQDNVNAELDKAADWFNKAIATKPDYAAAHFNLGLVYERQGRVADSVKKFEEVLSADPTDLSVAFQLAILYYRNDDKDASQALFEQIVTAQPDFANARWFLAAIYEEKGMYQEAIDQVAEVKKTNPDNPEVDAQMGALQQKLSSGATPEAVGLPEPVVENIATP